MTGRRLCWLRDWVKGHWFVESICCGFLGRMVHRGGSICNAETRGVKLSMNIHAAFLALQVVT
jgi:hypothetical protein